MRTSIWCGVLMDEVFGDENFVHSDRLPQDRQALSSELTWRAPVDYLLWYAKDQHVVKYRQLYQDQDW